MKEMIAVSDNVYNIRKTCQKVNLFTNEGRQYEPSTLNVIIVSLVRPDTIQITQICRIYEAVARDIYEIPLYN